MLQAHLERRRHGGYVWWLDPPSTEDCSERCHYVWNLRGYFEVIACTIIARELCLRKPCTTSGKIRRLYKNGLGFTSHVRRIRMPHSWIYWICKIDGDCGKWAFIWMVYMDCRTSHRLGTLLLPIIALSKFGHSIMSS